MDKILKVFVQKDCLACYKLKETLKQIDYKNIQIIDRNPSNKDEFLKYGVLSTPVMIFTQDDGMEISRLYGSPKREKITTMLGIVD